MTGRLPGDALRLSDARAAVLRAVTTQRHPTFRSVAEAAGLSLSTTADNLQALRHQGFVTWVRGQGGTLRPLYRPHIPRPCPCDRCEHGVDHDAIEIVR